MKRNDLVGQTFGRLTVTGIFGFCKKKNVLWQCKCSCGGEAIAYAYDLKAGKVVSCKCKAKEGLHTTHGYARGGRKRSKTYSLWAAMVQRCTNPNDSAYVHYGARGIFVDERWKSFLLFLEDMGEAPEGMSLERKDNNKGYSKDNCVWATLAQQSRNKRSNVWVMVGSEKMVFCDALRKIGYEKANAYKKIREKKLTHQEVLDIWLAEKKNLSNPK